MYDIKDKITTEFNIEGYPTPKFIELVLEIKPTQVTLVPDAPDVLTSNAGWDVLRNKNFLKPILKTFKEAGIRTCIFMETDENQIREAAKTGVDRIELYTGPYAEEYPINPEESITPYVRRRRSPLSPK